MNHQERKQHWENIFQTKELKEVSWYQETPNTSLEFFNKFDIPLSARIIDVGGGDSLLVDHLLDLGYQNITVLDISEAAINRAKERLKEKSKKVKWIIADVTTFTSIEEYDFWHDRAAFHFLTHDDDISKYINTVQKYLSKDGVLVIGTFSENGPTKCSGIEIKQYSKESLNKRLSGFFDKVNCFNIDHQTPFNTVQNFTFCSFKKKV